MLIKGTEDLRIQKTMAAIKESFEALICEKDYNNIKVTELCARAKINKKTFYHYYPTLDDLLSEMQMEMSAAYIELVKDYKLPEDAEKVNRIFFEYSAAQESPIPGCGAKVDPRRFLNKNPVPSTIYRIEVSMENKERAGSILEGKVLPIRSYGYSI